MLHIFIWLPYTLPILLFVHLFGNYWRLRHIPGPWYASCSNLYRLFVVWSRKSHDVYLKLHCQYGDVVRIGPNCVSISGPGTKENIYGIQKGFVKVSFTSGLTSGADFLVRLLLATAKHGERQARRFTSRNDR